MLSRVPTEAHTKRPEVSSRVDADGVRRLSSREMREKWRVPPEAVLMRLNGSVRPDLLDLVADSEAFVFGYRFPREWPDSIIAMVISSSPGSTGCVRTKLQMNDVLPVDGGSR